MAVKELVARAFVNIVTIELVLVVATCFESTVFLMFEEGPLGSVGFRNSR